MKRIKAKAVEELLMAEILNNEEFERDRTSQEYQNSLKILFHIHTSLEVETDNPEDENKEIFFVIALTNALARSNYSISRLLKCLEVCGFEVV